MKQDSLGKVFSDGFWANNAIFSQMLGMCPTLAVTTSAENGFGMGMATAAVIICSNMVVSAIRSYVPGDVRIPAFILIIASFVTIVDLSMNAYMYDLYQKLGIYIPLIVVNCVVLGRAEAFASKRGILESGMDGVGIGLGFTLALTLIGIVREFFGAGQFLGMQVMGEQFHNVLTFVMPPGAFLALGFLMAGSAYIKDRQEKAEEARKAAAPQGQLKVQTEAA